MVSLFHRAPVTGLLEYRILGRFEVSRGGEPLALGPLKQRAVLALLLINANQAVSTDRILDELWGDQAAGKQNALWVFVSQLRSALEPDRAPRGESSILISRSPGYVLGVDPDQIDAHRFERMLGEGRSLIEEDPEAASLVLGEALTSWRGRPLEDFMYEEFAQPEIARLDELRIEAIEDRIEADLRAGRGPDLVGELEALVREHPLRERSTGQLMLAFYRSGRQAEALRAYRVLEKQLGETLGIVPSPPVRQLEERIVMQDPELLAGSQPSVGPVPGLTIRGYELRTEIGRGGYGAVFNTYQRTVGREVAIKIIRAELADDADFIRRFEAEAALVARLEHPRIVPLYDYWREPGAAYLVMRLMKGGSLASLIASGSVSTDQAVQMIGEVSEALAEAHRQGIVHRDVKPSNILLDQEGGAYLADFAIAEGIPGRRPANQTPLDTPYTPPPSWDGIRFSVESDIYSLGAVLRRIVTGSDEGEPDPGASSRLLDVVDRATAASPSDRYPDVEAFREDLMSTARHREAAIAQAEPIENPYKGLRAFQEADSGTFFGRDRLVERLITRIGTGGRAGRFLTLVGPSGSGKSSVMQAGLLPALRGGAVPGSEHWYVAEMAPGAQPFEELEAALLRIAVDPPSALLEQLKGDNGGLARAIPRLLPDPDTPLLLVIDQLEELFTQTDDEQTRKSFLEGMFATVTASPGRVRVVATLRADFYDRPLRYHHFGELLRAGTEVVTSMSPEELEQAITRPAESVGTALEPGLAAAVVSDVADAVAALPLLQYAMTELFEHREGAMLTTDSYHQLGGVAGALGRRAESLFRSLDEDRAEAAHQVFLRLMTFGEGEAEVKRKVLRSELRNLGERPAVDRVVDTYGRHRLLSFDRDPVSRAPTVELAHEALLQEWPRYRAWVDAAKNEVLFQRRLNAAAVEWQDSGDTGYLLTGSRLAEAEAFEASTKLALTDLERRFISESSKQADEIHTTRRRRRLVVGTILAATAAIAIGFLVFAFTERAAADRLEAVGAINRLIEASEDALDTDPELSLLLAAQAAEDTQSLGMDVFPENLEVLHQGLRNQRLLFSVDDVTSAVFSPDGAIVYVGGGDGSVSVRDATTGVEIDSVPASSLGSVGAAPLAVSDDGRWLTNGYAVVATSGPEVFELRAPEPRQPVIDVDTGPGLLATAHFSRGADGRGEPGRVVALWDSETGTEVWSQDVVAPIYVDLSPDGTLLAVSNSPLSQEYSVIVFDVATGASTDIPLPVETLGLAFHPTEDLLLLGVGNVIRHWDIASQTFIGRQDGGHNATVSDLDISDDAAFIASGDQVGIAIIRDAETGRPLFPLPAHGGVIPRVELSPDGDRLATVAETQFIGPGGLRVFDTSVEGGRDLATIQTGLPMLASLDVDPSATLLAVGDHTGIRQLWTISGEPRLDLPAHTPFPGPVGIGGPIAISPDGATIVTGDAAGEIRLWDANTGALLAATTVSDLAPALGDTLGRLQMGRDIVFSVEYGPGGRSLAIGGSGFVLVTDAATLRDARVLRESSLTFSERLAFSPDGERLIAGTHLGFPPPEGFTNPVSVWDVSTGDEITAYPGGIPGSPAVDYSPADDLVAIGAARGLDAVAILDTASWEVVHILRSSSQEVWDVAFSPDGDQLAVGYADGGILIWEAHRGELLYSLPGHDGPAADLDWTDDGELLVSVGLDGTIRTFAMDAAAVVELAHARVTRGLTDNECRQYLGRAGC